MNILMLLLVHFCRPVYLLLDEPPEGEWLEWTVITFITHLTHAIRLASRNATPITSRKWEYRTIFYSFLCVRLNFFWVNVIKLLSIISLFCKDITGLFSDFYIWFSLLLNTYLSRIFFFMYNLRKWAKLIPPHVLLRIVTKLNTLSPPVDAHFITFYWKNDPTFTISM